MHDILSGGRITYYLKADIVDGFVVQFVDLQLGSLVEVNLDPPLERPFSFVHQKQKFRHRAMDELLDFARVKDRVVMVGNFWFFEIWSPDQYEQVREQDQTNLPDAVRHVGF